MRIFRYTSDIRSVAFILLCLTVYYLQWSGTLRHPALYLASLYFALVACVINHNHQHLSTYRGTSILIDLF